MKRYTQINGLRYYIEDLLVLSPGELEKVLIKWPPMDTTPDTVRCNRMAKHIKLYHPGARGVGMQEMLTKLE